MISDTNIPALNLKYDPLTNPEFNDKHFALLDTVGGKHSMRVDQLVEFIFYLLMIYVFFLILTN